MIQKLIAVCFLAYSVLSSCGQEPSAEKVTGNQLQTKPAEASKYLIIMEGTHCGELDPLPGLNWYGLYETDNERIKELKKVEIELTLRSSLSEEEAADVFGEENVNSDYLVRTSSEERSLFLIGSQQQLKEIRVQGTGWYETGNSGFLFPEQKESVFIPGYDELLIAGRENIYVSDSSSITIIRKYELWLSIYNRKDNERISQNITGDIPFTGQPASRHATHQVPQVLWCGDIDNDHRFDLLIYSTQMRESGDNLGFLILFLSSEAGEGEIVGKAAGWYFKVSCEG